MRPTTHADPLGPRARHALIAAALAVHLGVLLAAAGAGSRPRPSPAPAPLPVLLQVERVDAAEPSAPHSPTAQPAQAAPPGRSAPQPAAPRPDARAPVLAAAPMPEPPSEPVATLSDVASATATATVTVTVTGPVSTSATTATTATSPPAPAAPPAPADPAAPRHVTLSSTDWVRAPAYAYPREALRRREQGVVALRIRFDAQGVPRQVSLLRSSGSAALDEEALTRARASRARPRLQDGVPFEFLADTEAAFQF
jgi:periplasmic protein TonB